MGLIPPKYLWEDKGMGSNTEFLKSAKQIAEYYGCLQDNGKQIMNPGDNPITSDKMIDIICGTANVEPIKDTYGMVYYRPQQTGDIEVIKEQRLEEKNKENRRKAIIGQEQQEINIWNKQIIPVKVFKYLRTKIK